MDAAVAITAGPTAGSWKDELQATLSLAWPLMLANLTMQLIQATDVVLLGWLGPNELVPVLAEAASVGETMDWRDIGGFAPWIELMQFQHAYADLHMFVS